MSEVFSYNTLLAPTDITCGVEITVEQHEEASQPPGLFRHAHAEPAVPHDGHLVRFAADDLPATLDYVRQPSCLAVYLGPGLLLDCDLKSFYSRDMHFPSCALCHHPAGTGQQNPT